MGTFGTYQDTHGRYRWRMVGETGRVLANSAEHFDSEDAAEGALATFAGLAAAAPIKEDSSRYSGPSGAAFEIFDRPTTEWFWHFTVGNDVLADGPEGYPSERDARHAVSAVQIGLGRALGPNVFVGAVRGDEGLRFEGQPHSLSGRMSSLSVYVDPGSASAEEIAELYSALSDLHRVMGGGGLELVEGEADAYRMVGG